MRGVGRPAFFAGRGPFTNGLRRRLNLDEPQDHVAKVLAPPTHGGQGRQASPGDIAGNGISKLFLTIAAAFAEAERDRIRERIGQAKADQKARGLYLGGDVPFGFRRGDDGALVPHEAEQGALREIAALRAQGRSLQAIRDEMRARRASASHTRACRAP
jgi:hypothetical protein